MSTMHLTFLSSGLRPFDVHVSPKKDVSSTLNWNLSGLNFTSFSLAVSRVFSMC